MEPQPRHLVDPVAALIWMSVFAFFVGFGGYLAVSLAQPAAGRSLASVAPSAAAYAPARLAPPQDPWVFEKAI